MTRRDQNEYWRRVTEQLGQDGPAAIPKGLAAVATRRALAEEPRSPLARRWWALLLPYSVRAVAAASVVAALLFSAGAGRDVFSAGKGWELRSCSMPLDADAFSTALVVQGVLGATRVPAGGDLP